MIKKESVFPMVLGIAALVLAVVSFFILPDTVVTQLSIGSSNVTTMPKLLAIALPTVIGIGGAVAALFTKEGNKKKPLLISAIGIAVFAVMLIVNL